MDYMTHSLNLLQRGGPDGHVLFDEEEGAFLFCPHASARCCSGNRTNYLFYELTCNQITKKSFPP